MALDRERIFVSLFSRLSALEGIAYATRRWESWDDTPPVQQPSLMLLKGSEEPINVLGFPPRWRLMANVWLYAQNTADPDAAASTVLNTLLQRVEAALERVPSEGPVPFAPYEQNPSGGWGTTLGGLVLSCWISGTVDIYEGVIGQEAIAVVPIELLATA